MSTPVRKERDLLARAARCMPGGVLGRHRLPDDRAIVFARGRGAHLFDADGQEFIDFTCGGGALLLGYDNPEIIAAVRDQVAQASHFLSMANVPAIEYAADGVALIACLAHIEPTFTIDPPPFAAM